MTPVPAPAATPWWVAPAVIAAVIAAVATLIALYVNGRRAHKHRQRALFAAAFGDVAAYKEFPYIVRRRRHDTPAEERIRISSDLSEVQRKLNHNRAVLQVEAPRVARAYAELVVATRGTAGGVISTGWDLDPMVDDHGMHVTDVDLSPLQPFEDRFLQAAADHLALTPWWVRAGFRWTAAARLGRRRAGAALPAARNDTVTEAVEAG